MIRYIIKRAALAVGIIFSISLITFFILNVIPGDPVAAMLGEFADADKIAQVKAQMGLDTPLPVQYFNWLKDLLHGDMGTSYFQKKPVITLILQAFHYTVIMATAAYIVALIVGLTTGILAAVYHDRPAGPHSYEPFRPGNFRPVFLGSDYPPDLCRTAF